MSDLERLDELQPDSALQDGAARLEAINPDESYIVQAPAGSGKTALLTQRFLALLARVEQPEQIVAMTFTKKAAAEMRERIIATLKKGRAEQPPENAAPFELNSWKLARRAYLRDREENWSLLENPNRLRIKTIDGINGFLVAQMPLLSRMGAQPQISQNPDPLYVEAVRQLLKDRDCAEEMAALLALVNGRYHRAENLLVTMLKKRDQWMGSLLSMQGEAAREALEYALALIVKQEMQTQLAHLQGVRSFLEEAVALADFAAGNDQPWLQPLCGAWPLSSEMEDLSRWRLLAEWLLTKEGKSLRKSANKNIGFPAGKGEAKENKDAFLNALEGLRHAPDAERIVQSLNALKGLPDPAYSEAQWHNLQGLIRLLQRAAGYLKVVFRSRSEADFIEVAQAASQALGSELEPTELAQQLDYQIHHLLVDEFQDTSSEQYALIAKLVAGWQQGDGRTLFIVGDPMQSIYRFREAEVGNFLKAWQGQLGEVALTALNLEVNFRSSRSVVSWVNRTFARVFPDRDHIETGAVRFTPASARSELDDEAVFCHWRLNQSAEAEAVEVARLIKQRLDELDNDPEGSGKQVALLGRTRSSLMMIASLLKQQGIGFRAVELEALHARQEIQDCLALSRALLHLGDRPAWIALLRSPLVGLSLHDLHALLADDFYQPVWQQIQPDKWPPEHLSQAGRERLSGVLPVLGRVIERLGSLPFSVLLRECWLQLDGAQTVETRTALENVEVYWQTLAETDRENLTHDRLEALMAGLYARPDAAPESQRVQLMTMHKSKGLEFDTVILPGLGRKPRAGETELVSWLQFLGPLPGYDADDPHAPAQEWLVMAPLDQRGREPSLLSGLLKRFEQEKQAYELARLLYVAATRAKRRLHLYGSVPFQLSERDEQKVAPLKGSLLEPLWCCTGHNFDRLAAEYDESEERLEAPEVQPKISRLPLSRCRLNEWLQGEQTMEKEAVRDERPPLTRTENGAAALGAESIRSGVALLNTSVGNLVHAVLEQVVNEGVEQWSETQVDARAAHYALWLKQQGLQGVELERALQRVVHSLKNACRNETLRWALQASHHESETEYPLTSLNAESGAVENHIVDRTFIDESGTRWIIDYKTSYFEGPKAEIGSFIENQVTLYRDQLARYGALFSALDQSEMPQKWVLYFSYVDRWVEL